MVSFKAEKHIGFNMVNKNLDISLQKYYITHTQHI